MASVYGIVRLRILLTGVGAVLRTAWIGVEDGDLSERGRKPDDTSSAEFVPEPARSRVNFDLSQNSDLKASNVGSASSRGTPRTESRAARPDDSYLGCLGVRT